MRVVLDVHCAGLRGLGVRPSPHRESPNRQRAVGCGGVRRGDDFGMTAPEAAGVATIADAAQDHHCHEECEAAD